MPLAQLAQRDFSAGMYRTARAPSNGCFDLTDLLIDNQGLPFQRGGIEAYSGAADTSDFTTVHDALLETGRRVFWGTTGNFGTLDTDGVTPITLGPIDLFTDIPTPRRGTVIGGRLYVDGGMVYAGSRMPGDYETGTVAFTQGSTTVVGTGTSWLGNIAPGHILNVVAGENYVIASVTDDTHLELSGPYKGSTVSGQIYQARAVGAVRMLADIYGTAGRRLLAFIGDKIHFSRNQDPINEITRNDGTFQGIEALPDEDPENFHDGDYHQIPGSPQGLGLESWGDTAIAFTTDGVWLVSNMDLQPVDAGGNTQESLTHTAPQVVLWHRNGLAKFQDALVVPARDAVYIMGAGSLERIDAPIAPLYRDYVRQGLTLGVAKVFEGHYFLPVLDGLDHVDTLACRLDRPVRTQAGVVRPWSHFDGLPIRALAIQETAGAPNLLVASSGDKILRARYFEPDVVQAQDNGSTFTGQLITRDLPTGNGNQNVTREIDVDYDLVDSDAATNPTLIADFATGHPPETASYTSAGDNGPEGTDQFKQWLLDEPPRSRYVRVRLRPSARLKNFLIRGVTVWVRSSAKND